MKKTIKVFIYTLGYLAVFLPICFSIYYSVPACDDFAAAIRRNGQSLFSQSCRYGFGMWRVWGGRWLTQFFQTLLNPLNIHTHLGHKYGIFMIVIFVLTTVAIVYGLTVIIKRLLGESSQYVNIIRFLVVVILFSTNYYSECYNWYVGAMVYTVPFAFIFIAIASMIKYIDSEEQSNLHYWIIILAGIFPTTIEYCDLPMGLLYLYFIYYCRWSARRSESNRNKIKNIIPLLVYVACGISNVFAPGNSARQQYYNLELSPIRSFIQFIIDVVLRVQDLVTDKPFIMLLLFVVFFIGILSYKESNKCNEKIIAIFILFALITFGSLYPYIYGRALTTTYIDIRMEYVLDYCIELGLVVLLLKLGRIVAKKYNLQFDYKELFIICTGLGLVSYVTLIPNYAYLDIMQIDLLRNRSIIVESYNFWDGIMSEIENSDEDDVVITRDAEPTWSRYFFPLGLTDGDTYEVPYDKIIGEEQIMPNVYYEKNSITLEIED